MINSIVCVKQVPDTEMRIEIEDGQVAEEKLQYVINPYDEYAIEEALRLREKFSEGRITVLTLGPEGAREAIMQALAVGAHDKSKATAQREVEEGRDEDRQVHRGHQQRSRGSHLQGGRLWHRGRPL
jgi:electron transfer flavoprotein beta subunit